MFFHGLSTHLIKTWGENLRLEGELFATFESSKCLIFRNIRENTEFRNAQNILLENDHAFKENHISTVNREPNFDVTESTTP